MVAANQAMSLVTVPILVPDALPDNAASGPKRTRAALSIRHASQMDPRHRRLRAELSESTIYFVGSRFDGPFVPPPIESGIQCAHHLDLRIPDLQVAPKR